MCADFRTFLDNTHTELMIFFRRQLQQSDSRRKTRRPGANNYDIHFH
jgi:hypothetical protein